MNIIGLENAFAEFKIENIIKISTPDEFFKIQAKENKSYYEILPNIIKPFFDIENVSDEKEVFILIEAIKETFLKCFDFKITDYVLTKNEHSSNHNGLSYHLIIQKCKIEMNVLRRFVKNELKDFIIVDSTIYTKNRLFRTINSYGIAKNTIKDLNSVHYLYKCYQNNKLVFDKDDVEDEAPCGFLAGFKDILNNNFKNMTFISYLDNISDENILKANIETERKWTSLEQDKMNSKKHINHRIVTYSRNYLNLSNLEIKDGNIIIPLSKKSKMNESNEEIEKEIYDKIIVLLEFELNENSKNKLLNMKSYYDSNNSFKDYKLTLNQIKYMIELIEKQSL